MRILLTGNTAFKLANFRMGLIRSLIADGHRLTALVPADEHSDRLREAGCDVVALLMSRKGVSPVEESRLLHSFYTVFRTVRPDVILSYTIKNNIYGAMAARWLGIPFIPNVTGLGTAFERPNILNATVTKMYQTAFKKVPAVFFQNAEDRKAFLRAGIVSPKVARLLPGSGIDLQRFRKESLPAGDGTHFMMVSRMLRDKGPGEFVTAAQKLRSTGQSTQFSLVGPLDLEGTNRVLQEEIEAWTADGTVRYLGEVRDVRPCLLSADCVVLPSYYKEGTPRVLLEAAAMGRPLITTDTPGCRDTVDHGRTGFLCKPADANDLARVMEQYCSLDRDDRARMGAAGADKMAKGFDETIVIRAYYEVLATLGIHAERTSVSVEA